MRNASELSPRQKKIFEVIRDFVAEYGYPPTIRQIGEMVGISSTSVVSYNLNILQRHGLITRDRDVSRGLRVVDESLVDDVRRSDAAARSLISIPLLGTIAAGEPIPVPDSDFALAEAEQIELTSDVVKNPDQVYALRVRGHSMVDALINDGDIVIMRHQSTANNGDMVAAWLKDERSTTLKRFYLERQGTQVRLQPANPQMEPIYVHPSNVEIQGKVIGVVRRLD